MKNSEVPDMAFDICILVSALLVLSMVTGIIIKAYEQMMNLLVI